MPRSSAAVGCAVATFDLNKYQKGIKISDEDLSKVNIVRDDFHGEWNYTIIQA